MDDTESLTPDPDFSDWLDARAAEYIASLDTSDEALVATLTTLTIPLAEVSA